MQRSVPFDGGDENDRTGSNKPDEDHIRDKRAVRFTLGEKLYSAQEVAASLNVSERWVRDHATRRSPRLRAIKLGPLLRFRETDVAAFIDEIQTKEGFKRR